MKNTDEIIEYLLSAKETFEYLKFGIDQNNYWAGYYQGKLDLTDFILRFIVNDFSKSFGGFTKEETK